MKSLTAREGCHALSVLLILDDGDLLDTFVSALDSDFGTVDTALSMEKGLERFRNSYQDIVVVDADLGGSDGMTLAATTKLLAPDTTVLMLEHFETPDRLSEALRVGVDAFLEKPVAPSFLGQRLQVIGRRLYEQKRYLYKKKILEEYKRAVDVSAIVSRTDPEGKIIYVNKAFCDISGYSETELLGARHNIVRDPDISASYYAKMWQAISAGKIWKGTFKNRRKDGVAYYVSATIVPIFDENGEIEEYLSIRQDMTELQQHRLFLQERVKQEVEHNLAQRREREEERLQEAKFSAIGRLAAGITHEINTPLTYIRGNLEMMHEDIDQLEAGKNRDYLLQDIKTVMEGVNRIANIVDSMREMSSHSDEAMRPHNLYATIVTALTIAQNRSKQICTITFDGEPFVPGMDKNRRRIDVCMQQQRIEQVWIIIINNALDVLKKIAPYESRKLEIGIREYKHRVAVTFRDNGGGIDPEILPKVFEPFESTKQEGGIGIGLNIARRITEMHRGTIKAANRSGGALFTVSLPRKCSKRRRKKRSD